MVQSIWTSNWPHNGWGHNGHNATGASGFSSVVWSCNFVKWKYTPSLSKHMLTDTHLFQREKQWNVPEAAAATSKSNHNLWWTKRSHDKLIHTVRKWSASGKTSGESGYEWRWWKLVHFPRNFINLFSPLWLPRAISVSNCESDSKRCPNNTGSAGETSCRDSDPLCLTLFLCLLEGSMMRVVITMFCLDQYAPPALLL